MSQKIIFISRFPILEAGGHGGHHRTYQIWRDLCRLVGEGNVITINLEPQNFDNIHKNALSKYWKGLGRRLRFLGTYLSSRGNPTRFFEQVFSGEKRDSNAIFGCVPTQEYEQLVYSLGRPIICLIDHPNQGNIIDWNARNNIPTVCCPQNLESLDLLAGSFESRFRTEWFFRCFSQEINMLSECSERLFISKVETGLLGGLGLSSAYYPYLPVGVIRERLELIRHKREDNQRINPNHFLLIGSAVHHTTEISFTRFINQVVMHGLPEGVRLTVVGKDTEKLLSDTTLPLGLDVRGWLSQETLDDLMCEVNAVIITQPIGFGALTRLPELSCAGIPMIVSSHATYAINTPPGVFSVNDEWDEWVRRVADFSKSPPLQPGLLYSSWEQEQPRPLGSVIERWGGKIESNFE